MNGDWQLRVELREPEVWEADASCNGCHAPTVYRLFVIGSRDPNGRGNGSEFRLCRECTHLLKEEVAK